MEELQESPDSARIKPKRALADLIKSEAAVRGTDLIAGAVAIGVIFWWLQFSTSAICCGDFDGYYHTKWAQMLWQNFRARHFSPPSFIWLPLTTLNLHDYVDHHLLFHIILIPFTWFRDLQTGAKVAAALFASVAVFFRYLLIVRFGNRYLLNLVLALLSPFPPVPY